MTSKIKVALVQLYPKPLSPHHNFSKAESFIRSAASQGCHLAILPEYFLTSWHPTSADFTAACATAASLLPSLRALASALSIAIVAGTLIETLPDGARANTCYFISSKGEIAGRYLKRNLWHPERGVIIPGSEAHDVFRTEFGPVGLLVCWDLAFPEAMRELVAKGAKLVVVPSWWLMSDAREGGSLNPQAEKIFLDSMVVCRAFENTCAVGFVNAGAPATSAEAGADAEANGALQREYAGLSQVGMPLLGAVGKLGVEEGMSVVEIDTDVLDVAERSYRVREDLARANWHYHVSSKLD